MERHDELDLALLRVVGAESPLLSLPLADVGPGVGDPVRTVSFPGLGDGRRTTASLAVTVVARTIGDGPATLLALDARTAPGASGGAVLDTEGAVVGILVQYAEGQRGRAVRPDRCAAGRVARPDRRPLTLTLAGGTGGGSSFIRSWSTRV